MPDWPADRVERRALGELVASARNARVHSDTQIEQLMASIREWGWTMPVLVDEAGMIIAGHGRVLAAERLQLDQVPIMVARGWSEAQKRAYLIADNKLTENGAWDQALLRLELGELAQMGFAMPLTGFSLDEIEALAMPDNDALREWVDMPEFEQNAKDAHQTIIVHFKDQAAVDRFQNFAQQQITSKTKWLWYPKQDTVHHEVQYASGNDGAGDPAVADSPAVHDRPAAKQRRRARADA